MPRITKRAVEAMQPRRGYVFLQGIARVWGSGKAIRCSDLTSFSIEMGMAGHGV